MSTHYSDDPINYKCHRCQTTWRTHTYQPCWLCGLPGERTRPTFLPHTMTRVVADYDDTETDIW